MKINKFKKMGTNKYKLFFDNDSIVVYEDVIIKYNLLYKKEIDSDLLLKINEDNYKASIYDTALKYIGIRMRSKKELEDYLVKKKFDAKDINDTIDKLLYQGLLNDAQFCKSYVYDKIHLTNSGLDKIKAELIKLGIDEDTINSTFETVDKDILDNKLNKIINKEVKANSKLPVNKMRNKIINKCINLGYELARINEILENSVLVSTSNIDDDYNKLYTKYSNKYDEYKLNSVLKSKLYQKGYTFEEINKVVDN